MQQKHVFWVKYFGKSVFGHFFCPFLTFPKYFQSKKHDIFKYHDGPHLFENLAWGKVNKYYMSI
jgi:hypothetical protein